jgi:DNA polymerase-1
LVIPEDGCGIGEVDWSQVEVGVAAAVYNDEELIKMFNSGDVYSAMAQHFFREDLSEEDLAITGKEFKRKHKELRNRMKSCTLGIIYGITPVGLSQTLGTTKAKAALLQERFMAMFPCLQAALILAAQCGTIRGYAFTISGLKRHRAKSGEATRWERNWLTNHPVQGSAAVVFKAAGNRLDKLYQQYDAKIIIPLHDAFIFEAPLNELKKVAELTARVMCDTMQEYFPVLRPQVEVNISRPNCWNKDGDDGKLERWIEDLNLLMEDQENVEHKA